MRKIDLHIHTTASDGADTPTRVVEIAASSGVAAIAITDHDTVSGVAEAAAAGERLGVEVIPGIEVSSDYRDNNVHLLGYFIDAESPAMAPVLSWVRIERETRNEKLCAMLAADGFDIDIGQLRAAYPDAVLGRPHIAEFLMRKGYVSSVTEGFDKYLEVGRPYYLPKRRISLEKAAETIIASGGVPVLAHPLQYGYPLGEVVEMIAYAKSLGVRALECFYSEHTPEQQAWLIHQSQRFHMGISGGSDYHGIRKPHIAIGSGTGRLFVPYPMLSALKALR